MNPTILITTYTQDSAIRLDISIDLMTPARFRKVARSAIGTISNLIGTTYNHEDVAIAHTAMIYCDDTQEIDIDGSDSLAIHNAGILRIALEALGLTATMETRTSISDDPMIF